MGRMRGAGDSAGGRRGRPARGADRRARRLGRRVEQERRGVPSDEEAPEVRLGDLGTPEDVGRQGHDDVRLGRFFLVSGEQAPDEWDVGDAGNAREAVALVVENEPGQQVGLAVREAECRDDLPVVERGQALEAGGAHRGDVELQLQSHLAVVVNPGGDVDVDADVLVLEGT